MPPYFKGSTIELRLLAIFFPVVDPTTRLYGGWDKLVILSFVLFIGAKCYGV